MCIRDRVSVVDLHQQDGPNGGAEAAVLVAECADRIPCAIPVSYTHLRAHETVLDLVCRLLLEKKNKGVIRFAKFLRLIYLLVSSPSPKVTMLSQPDGVV